MRVTETYWQSPCLSPAPSLSASASMYACGISAGHSRVAVSLSLRLPAPPSIDGCAAAPANATARLLLFARSLPSVKDEGEDARELVNGLADTHATCANYYGVIQKRGNRRNAAHDERRGKEIQQRRQRKAGQDRNRLAAILPRTPPTHASVGNRHNSVDHHEGLY